METTTTENTVDYQREQQQVELQQIQQRQEELARLQEQQAQLQQQLEAATASLGAQEISTQVQSIYGLLFSSCFEYARVEMRWRMIYIRVKLNRFFFSALTISFPCLDLCAKEGSYKIQF